MKKVIIRKVKGYVLTFEVIFTLAMMFTLMTITLYFLSALDAQRYMNTILTSTAIQMSKSGGRSNSYTRLNGIEDIISSSQNELDRSMDGSFNAKIDGTPAAVTSTGEKVYVKLTWEYPPLNIVGYGFNIGDEIAGNKIEMYEIYMDSLVEPGGLLN